MDAACEPTWREIAIIFGVAGSGLPMRDVMGVIKPGNLRRARDTSKRRAVSLLAVDGCSYGWAICLVAGPSVATRALPAIKDLIARLHGDVLNAHDLALQRRGYYEELDVGRMDNWRCHDAQEPEGWNAGRKLFYRERSDFLMKEAVPSVSTVLGGTPVTSNRLGMRDRDTKAQTTEHIPDGFVGRVA